MQIIRNKWNDTIAWIPSAIYRIDETPNNPQRTTNMKWRKNEVLPLTAWLLVTYTEESRFVQIHSSHCTNAEHLAKLFLARQSMHIVFGPLQGNTCTTACVKVPSLSTVLAMIAVRIHTCMCVDLNMRFAGMCTTTSFESHCGTKLVIISCAETSV